MKLLFLRNLSYRSVYLYLVFNIRQIVCCDALKNENSLSIFNNLILLSHVLASQFHEYNFFSLNTIAKCHSIFLTQIKNILLSIDRCRWCIIDYENYLLYGEIATTFVLTRRVKNSSRVSIVVITLNEN